MLSQNQFSYDHWSQASWAQPVFRWVKLSGEWWVLLWSNLGLKPTWLLRETGNSALEADDRIHPNQKCCTDFLLPFCHYSSVGFFQNILLQNVWQQQKQWLHLVRILRPPDGHLRQYHGGVGHFDRRPRCDQVTEVHGKGHHRSREQTRLELPRWDFNHSDQHFHNFWSFKKSVVRPKKKKKGQSPDLEALKL